MNSKLALILESVKGQLASFAWSEQFWPLWDQCFASRYDETAATQLRQQWQEGNFNQFPSIEVLNDESLGLAQAAYASSTQTIYLSAAFLAKGTTDAITEVVLGEFGHHVDALINTADTPGDEGELFSLAVQRESSAEARLRPVQAEDDYTTISPGGSLVPVEQSGPVILIVNTTVDEDDGRADVGTGLSLRDAVRIANQASGTPHVIRLQSGATYELSLNWTDDLYEVNDVKLIANGIITIETNGAGPAIVKGGGPRIVDGVRRFDVHNSLIANQKLLAISDLSIMNPQGRGLYNEFGVLKIYRSTVSGDVADSGDLAEEEDGLRGGRGGGIFNFQGRTTIMNSSIQNSAAATGGGIYNQWGILEVIDSEVCGNRAVNIEWAMGGGGIYNRDGITRIEGSIISDNLAEGRGHRGNAGGGIFSEGSLEVTNSIINRNFSSGSGGGISAEGYFLISNSDLIGNSAQYSGGAVRGLGQDWTITNNRFSHNSAADGAGVSAGGSGVLENNKISSNTAINSGGGGNIWGNSTGGVMIKENLISDNIARNDNTMELSAVGGGIGGGLVLSGEISVANCIIQSNTAGGTGGGIYSVEDLDLINTSISENTAVDGGGLYTEGDLYSEESEFNGNTASGNGGGIYGDHGTRMTLIGVSASKNAAVNGGGLYAYGYGDVYSEGSEFNDNTASGNGGGIFNAGDLSLLNSNASYNHARVGGGLYNTGSYYSNSSVGGNTSTSPWYVHPMYPDMDWGTSPSLDKLYWSYWDRIIQREVTIPYKLDPRHPDLFDLGTVSQVPSEPADQPAKPQPQPQPQPQEPPPTAKPTISISNSYAEIWGDAKTSSLWFDVELSSEYSDGSVQVDIYTRDGSASGAYSIGEAANKDYYGITKQTLVFEPGETRKWINVLAWSNKQDTTDSAYEIFARDTAYRTWSNDSKGVEVDQVYDYHDKGYEGYRINKVFHDPSTDFDAVGLTADESFYVELANPKNAELKPDAAVAVGTIYDESRPPVLAIRGTYSLKDLLADLAPEGIGYRQFTNNKASLIEWLNQVSNPEPGIMLRPSITGHSLGGALSQWLAGAYSGELGEIVTFNSPGVSPHSGIDLSPSNNLGVRHYITSADLVSMAGSTYLDGEWAKSSYQDAEKLIFSRILDKHSMPVLTDTITRIGLQKPSSLQRTAFSSSSSLSSPYFSYLPDPEWLALQATIIRLGRAVGPLTGVLASYVAAALTYRITVEAHRQAIGTLIDKIFGIPEASQPGISGSNSTIYNAALSYSSQAWQALLNQSNKKLGISSSQIGQEGDSHGDTFFAASSSEDVFSKAAEDDLIDNFWDAIHAWGDEAWLASSKWTDRTWDSMTDWSPQAWQATTQWSTTEWQKPFTVVANQMIREGDDASATMNVEITLSNPSIDEVRIDYSTADGSAQAGQHYSKQTGTLVFAPGETTKSISIQIFGNRHYEKDRDFTLSITPLVGASILNQQATITILNDDPMVIVENNGNVALLKGLEDQAVVEHDGRQQAVRSPWGATIGDASSEWKILAAETIDGVNMIVRRHKPTQKLQTWTLDENWSWLSSSGLINRREPEGWQLETGFQMDLNRDSIIGAPFTTVESQGNTSLLRREDGQALVRQGEASYAVTSPVGASTVEINADWQMIAAESVLGQNTVLWNVKSTNQLHTWTLDASWVWQSSSGMINRNSAEAWALETNFQMDLNGDSIIGTPFTTIEIKGNTKLLRRKDGQAVVERDGLQQAVSSPWGATIGDASSEWKMLAAETIDGVNMIVRRHKPTQKLQTWTLDENWSWLSSSGLINRREPEGWQLETGFQMDLNRDSIIGAP
ncbi:MAG: Calx-beta domain-containing protein [Synechococcaceae cyanobacterium]